MSAQGRHVEDGVWYVTRERWEVLASDGSSLNYSAGADEASARAFVARFPKYAGATLVRRVDVVREAPYMQVLLEAAQGDEDAVRLMSLDMQRMLNMAHDAGRPSDAARSSARAFLNGSLTWESYRAARPS